MAKSRSPASERYSRWTVVSKLHGSLWLCRCDCGTEKLVISSTVKSGRSKSCGCYKLERARTHGKSRTPIYELWSAMIKRCYTPSNGQYPNYGGRGISVCRRWHTFENFYADMGERPKGMSLDRIDNDGDYKPSNCRWTTQKQQIRNKRNTARVMYQGKHVSLAELCEQRELPLKRVRNRLYAGWTVEQALDPERQSRWRTGR